MTNRHLLEANSVSVQRNKKLVLQDINFCLAAGEVMTIIGPNGAGKSTLIAALGGGLKASSPSGSVVLDGKNINDFGIKEKARSMAVLSQSTQLDFPFTVAEVIALGRTPHDTGLHVDQQIVFEVSALLELEQLLTRFYPQLSGGEQQRVQLARVLVQVWQEPDQNDAQRSRVLLLDEPSAAFDLKNQSLLAKAIKLIADQNVAVVTVAHDINLALTYSQQFLCLSKGEQVACGDVNSVIRKEILEPVFSVKMNLLKQDNKNAPILTFL